MGFSSPVHGFESHWGRKFMKKLQKDVEKFLKSRDWQRDHLYDVLLNIHEEVDELWNIVKHLAEDRYKKTLRRIINQSREELDDGIGDLAFLILKLAVHFGIDAEKAVRNRLEEFRTRFPAKAMRKIHGNLRAGGVDRKYKK